MPKEYMLLLTVLIVLCIASLLVRRMIVPKLEQLWRKQALQAALDLRRQGVDLFTISQERWHDEFVRLRGLAEEGKAYDFNRLKAAQLLAEQLGLDPYFSIDHHQSHRPVPAAAQLAPSRASIPRTTVQPSGT